MTRGTSRVSGSFGKEWVWLFPASYLLHIAEEYFGGFPSSFSDFTGLSVSNTAFLAVNALFWLLMVAAAWWAHRSSFGAPIVVLLGTIVTINASLHGAGALLTGSYSPGMMSGLFLWLPLGISSLVRGKRMLSSSAFRNAVFLGIGIHLLVPLVGVGSALMLP